MSDWPQYNVRHKRSNSIKSNRKTETKNDKIDVIEIELLNVKCCQVIVLKAWDQHKEKEKHVEDIKGSILLCDNEILHSATMLPKIPSSWEYCFVCMLSEP